MRDYKSIRSSIPRRTFLESIYILIIGLLGFFIGMLYMITPKLGLSSVLHYLVFTDPNSIFSYTIEGLMKDPISALIPGMMMVSGIVLTTISVIKPRSSIYLNIIEGTVLSYALIFISAGWIYSATRNSFTNSTPYLDEPFVTGVILAFGSISLLMAEVLKVKSIMGTPEYIKYLEIKENAKNINKDS